MKHFRKVCAVLLAVAMVAVILPAALPVATPVEAADPGVVTNGGFETGNFDNWNANQYGPSISTNSSYKRSGTYGCRVSKDSSHNGSRLLTQVIPVNTNAQYTFSFYVKAPQTNCDYVACFTYSLALGTTAGTCTTSVADKATVNPGGTSWTQITHTVNTGNNKYLEIEFYGTGAGSSDSGLDDVALKVENAGDAGTHAKPTLTSFSTDKNRPNNANNNVIKEPGFEGTSGAQWNNSTFLANGVSHVTGDAANAHSGNGYLKYYRGSVAPATWSIFEVTLPTSGEYVFSAWVRTPYLSANNQGKASIGVINPDTGKFLTYSKKDSGGDEDYYGHVSTPEIQLRSTATDDKWHLRSVTFYVGAPNSNVKIGMYGLSSEMYVDDISIHLVTNGVTYSGDQKGALSVSSTNPSNKYCEAANNLIPDCNFNGAPSEKFWTYSASGWNNGFMSIEKDAQDESRGNTLHFKGNSTATNKQYHYIKWVYVERNTQYTVSFDYRVAGAGNQLMFIDNNIDKPVVFHTPSLGSASNSWKTYAFTFTSGNYDRIGIVFRNHNSANLYFDDFRFFKTSDAIANEPAEEIFPTLKHTGGEKSRQEIEKDMAGNAAGPYSMAFRFHLASTGAVTDENFVGNYAAAQVQAFEDGNNYKLIKTGAVMTNDSTVGQDADAFVLDSVNAGKSVIDVNAHYLYETTNDSLSFAVRITNIPERHISTVIYARPYYVFEYNGREITVYGDIAFDSYEPLTDVNDGWLEWD